MNWGQFKDHPSGFSQTHKIGNIAIIANFVFPQTSSFLLYLQRMLLLNMTLDISGYNMIIFQGCKLSWYSSFVMEQLKTKLAILAFLYCGEFVKKSLVTCVLLALW